MAQPSKSRARRSSSSTSYSSTLTTLIFTALCVLGIWMLTSNSVVTPKTHTAIDDNNSESTNTQDLAEYTPETTTTTSTTNIIQQDDPLETTTHIADESSREAITNVSDEPRETTTSISEELRETAINIFEEPRETTTNTSEESSESVTESQDQKEGNVYGDNPGNLPDDAIANEGGNTDKKEVSSGNEAIAGVVNDQKSDKSEKEAQNVQVSEGEQKVEEENQNMAQDEKENPNTKQNAEGENVNTRENQEEGTSGGQQSFDVQGGKNNDDEANVQQLREDKGEVVVMEKEAKEKEQEEVLKKETVATEVDESEGEKKKEKEELGEVQMQDLKWSLCNVSTGGDYIPCLDNDKYLKTSTRKHFVHRERHCPEDAPTCLVPLPKGYKVPIQWPSSRDKVWFHNVPHTLLADVKGHQNWMKLKGEFLTFPGGGTQFIHGALHYIDFLQQAEPGIGWGKHTRVILDVGCGVGSFGGFLFERDVISMSFAPKDEHEAQVQFALERGIPAISAVMGTQRLQFPSHAFDLIHCARCRVPWHEDGGLLLLELNRLLRPGGYFVWCATPVYQTIEEDAQIWKQMTSLTKAICWELVTIKKDKLNQVGAAFYRKPLTNECYDQREQNQPPMCKVDDDPNSAWYVPLQACMHKLPVGNERGTKWPEAWPQRLQKVPEWLKDMQGGEQLSQDFAADNERWKNVIDELSNIGVSWSHVRNIMDMRASYGGFAAAMKDLPVWVFNVVNIDASDTLPVIYERGLIGIYHDWCESFSTYPRTYDLLHADHLFSNLMKRCNLVPVVAEIDRILRPGGNLIVRDDPSVIGEVENLLKSLHWEITSTNQEGLLNGKKGMWRPSS
ncbi:S-adenosyl-L-methionine-dependent methyltransferase [Vigna unguiculata]|uniref:S-adenosyl-L-methionine-dependent methyltransferase n=1 Tax=Vigna unguiculata TaxID=3917 RepID=A0A4D6KWD5_VIGUN|nr:S-adenosyl-L-methionine-dependent methyltransferase [Vigna unguiculata]